MSDPSHPGLDDSWFDRGRPPPLSRAPLTRAAVMAELARRNADVVEVDPDDPDVDVGVEVEFSESFFDR